MNLFWGMGFFFQKSLTFPAKGRKRFLYAAAHLNFVGVSKAYHFWLEIDTLYFFMGHERDNGNNTLEELLE